jgi:hypothetical protein
MKSLFPPCLFLTDTTDRLGILLTLIFFSIFPLHALSAGDPNAVFVSDEIHTGTAIDANDKHQRLGALRNYVRSEALNLMPGLPDIIRNPARWALGGFQVTQDFFDFITPSKDDEAALASLIRPVTSYMRPTSLDEGDAAWLAPSYHHRQGILPTRDAMMMGFHSRSAMFDSYMRLDAHPYYAQNWFSQRGYWGAELALDLASPSDKTGGAKPWGKIVLGYTNGDDRLMDHGRGIDLQGELRLSERWSFNTGMRQSDQTGNYALLQWKMPLE